MAGKQIYTAEVQIMLETKSVVFPALIFPRELRHQISFTDDNKVCASTDKANVYSFSLKMNVCFSTKNTNNLEYMR